MHAIFPHGGWIEAITGCMFSGKSEELIRRLRRAVIARQRIQIFKPRLDTRYEEDAIVSHSQQRLDSIAVADVKELLASVKPGVDVIGIDEAQFFDDSLVAAVRDLAFDRKRVIVAGLDLDYLGEPFGPMPQILAQAEFVSKQLAICMICGAPAKFTQRLTDSHQRIEIGATGMYEARCRMHYEPPTEES